jgi:hypothetical protein
MWVLQLIVSRVLKKNDARKIDIYFLTATSQKAVGNSTKIKQVCRQL